MGLAVLVAMAADLVFGEPKTSAHPVALIGRAMGKVGEGLRIRASRPASKRIMGAVLVGGFVAVAFSLSYLLIARSGQILPEFGWAVNTVFIWLSISVGELIIACKKINRLLESGGLAEARRQLRCLVGRDPDNLTDRQVRTAALESLAENLVDAGVAPLFYAFLGGGALAFAYRIINTMDSMFGYKNDTYIDFGWAAARLDDMAAWVPARLTVIFLAAANRICGREFRTGIRAAFNDGSKHPSPNSGLPMAAMAGALDIQLGGQRLYNGKAVLYGYFGKNAGKIDDETVNKAAGLAAAAFFISAIAGSLIGVYIKGVSWLIG